MLTGVAGEKKCSFCLPRIQLLRWSYPAVRGCEIIMTQMRDKFVHWSKVYPGRDTVKSSVVQKTVPFGQSGRRKS